MSLLRLHSPFSLFGEGIDDFFAVPSMLVPRQSFGENNNKNNRSGNNPDTSMWTAFQLNSGVHVHEDDSNYSVSIDLPGIKPSDVCVKLEDDGRTIRLSGHRKFQSVDSSGKSESKFVRRFTVGDDIDVEKLTANLSDGVLTLSAPKKAPRTATARQIEITTTAS
jgi:HSP20 family protein